MKKLQFFALKQLNWMNYFTRYSTKNHNPKQKY
mgnify:CR=1 FL=1